MKQLSLTTVLLIAFQLVLLAEASKSTSQQTTTFFPGALLAWFICSQCKRKQVGGWLLFFYWQLYSGLLLSAVLFAVSIHNYVPAHHGEAKVYLLFLTSTVPELVLFVFTTAVATLALVARTSDMLRLLRWALLAEVLAGIVGLAIDTAYFQENIALGVFSTFSRSIWTVYFYRSDRVRHVFVSHDWGTAVHSIHPLKLTHAT